MKKWLPLVIIVGIILILGNWYVSTNNMLVEKEGLAKAQWANVESSYQRRADLIPNLVATVKGYAAHEKETLEGVIQARSEATKPEIKIGDKALTPENMKQFQQAQSGLSSALSRLLVTVERYPDLKANQNFLELQSQLEGTENRINVERNRFNELAGEYNIVIKKIPTNIIAGIAGFDGMPLYESDSGSENAPKVEF